MDTDADPMLCPDCGWTGTADALDSDRGVDSCPVCDTDIEVVD